jgi:hypothetical protein
MMDCGNALLLGESMERIGSKRAHAHASVAGKYAIAHLNPR